MRIFVGEFLCGGGMLATDLEQIPSTLLREGMSMWRALIDDFSQWAEVVTPLDRRLVDELAPANPRVRSVKIDDSDGFLNDWIVEAKTCDWALIVAPETDQELERSVAAFREAGVQVLACTEAVIRMASDKWLTAEWLSQHGIPTPLTWSAEQLLAAEHPSGPPRELAVGCIGSKSLDNDSTDWLRKPRDGCSGDAVRASRDWRSLIGDLDSGDVLQTRVAGRSASVIVLGNDHEFFRSHEFFRNRADESGPLICPVMWQDCRWETGVWGGSSAGDLSVRYRGGSGPATEAMQRRGLALAERVCRALPGSQLGFIGIDMILAERPEDDCVIEINPRMTTSYVGVRHLTDGNLTSIWNPNCSNEVTFRGGSDQIRWNVEGPAGCPLVGEGF